MPFPPQVSVPPSRRPPPPPPIPRPKTKPPPPPLPDRPPKRRIECPSMNVAKDQGIETSREKVPPPPPPRNIASQTRPVFDKTSGSGTVPGQQVSATSSPQIAQEQTVAPAVVIGATNMASKYEILEQIGSGTYGYVFRGRVRGSDNVVALKKIKLDDPRPEPQRDGFPITALREIKILSCMSHPNIVRLEEIVTSSDTNSQNGESRSVPSSIYMVFEYCEGDLLDVLKAVREGRFQLTRDHVCSFTRQLLEGMLYIHSNRVVHRDIKAANILVTRNCRLKIADWGLARSWRPLTEPAEATADEDVGANVHHAVASARKSEKEKGSRYTDNVVTLWYRAPELLMGVSSYTTAIDIWSIGCLVAELFLLRTLFQGRDELEQMHLIFRSCGTPAPKSWMRAPASRPATQTTALSSSHRPPLPARPRRLKEELAGTSGGPDGADLVDKLLALDPSCRLTAIQALDHEFLWQDEPKDPEELPPLVPLRRMVPTAGGKG